MDKTSSSQTVKILVDELEQQKREIERQLREARNQQQNEATRNLPSRIEKIQQKTLNFIEEDKQRRQHRVELTEQLCKLQNAQQKAVNEIEVQNLKARELDEKQILEKVA